MTDYTVSLLSRETLHAGTGEVGVTVIVREALTSGSSTVGVTLIVREVLRSAAAGVANDSGFVSILW